jgi:hypothetical protein
MAHIVLAHSASGVLATLSTSGSPRAAATASLKLLSASFERGLGDYTWRMEPCSLGFIHS